MPTQGSVSQGPSAPGDTPPPVGRAAVCVAALLMAAAEVTLLCLMSGSILHDARLSLITRWSAVGWNLLVLGVVVALAGLGAIGLLRLTSRLRSPVGRRGARGTTALAVGVLVLLWGWSWGAFWSTGAFLTRASLDFWLGQPVQMLHWAPPPLLYGLPLIALATGVLLVWGVPAWLGRDTLTRRAAPRMAALMGV